MTQPSPSAGPTSRPLSLITGASDGIGRELARLMAARGHDLALAARSRDRLESLADDIAATGRPRPLVLVADLADPAAIENLVAGVEAAGAHVEILVNNAGYGLIGPARTLDRRNQLGVADLNIRALTDLTLRLLPGIVAARGRILHVASIGSFLPGPYMAVYYASKAYVLSFGEALSKELESSGVTVTTLCPGPTVTGFQARAGMSAGTMSKMPSMSARAVAEAGYAGMMAGRRVVVPGWRNKLVSILAPLTPRGLLLGAVARMQESRKG